ncbi:MAG: thiamine ABC transporter substrate-binding protein [Nocardioidaceae bacterium]
MSLPRALAAVLATGLLASCSVGGTTDNGTGSSKQIVVATHDSWAMSKSVIRRFQKKSGYTVRIEPNGDVGQLTNKLVLTKGAPIADMVYGIDNTFASRAVDAGVLAPYTPGGLPGSAARFALAGGAEARDLTPVDYGDVCVNVDDAWFARHHQAPPRTLDDLTRPGYKNLFVTEGASTSSPGLAFLLSTIARYGAGWQGYWSKLMANGTKVDSGWDEAWNVDYTAGGGNGTRPIVLSYSSSPPDTIPKGGSRPTTSALLDTCFRQVEYAGVLKGAQNARGAQAFIRFMLQHSFQQALPSNMYVYPVDTSVPLPADWARYAAVSPHPFTLPAHEIATHRAAWLRSWADVTSG